MYEFKEYDTSVSSMIFYVIFINKPKRDTERVKQYEKYLNNPIFSRFEYPLPLKGVGRKKF